MAEAGGSSSHASGYKTRVPTIPEGTGSHTMDSESSEGTGVYDHGQGSTAAVVVGDREM